MNNKDVSTVRKQIKTDNEMLNITEIFNVYEKKETSEIYHQESRPFGMLEQFHQELFMQLYAKLCNGPKEQNFPLFFHKKGIIS